MFVVKLMLVIELEGVNRLLLAYHIFTDIKNTAPTPSAEECSEVASSCGDGTCLQKFQWCDGQENCADGRDETNCSECYVKQRKKICRITYLFVYITIDMTIRI